MFELKEAETSNSLLVVKDLLQGDQCKELKNLSNGDCETSTEDMEQDLDSDKENKAHKVTVVKTFYHYLEMKPAKPGYQKLSQLHYGLSLLTSIVTGLLLPRFAITMDTGKFIYWDSLAKLSSD